MRRWWTVAALVLLVLAGVAGPAASASAAPPFTPPAEWAAMCDATRAPAKPLVRGTNCRWVIVDGHPRRFLVYVPTNRAFPLDRQWPLVLAFHGTDDTGERFARVSGWRATAEQHGIVVAFPTSLRYGLPGGGTIARWHSFGLPAEIDPEVRLDGYPEAAPMPADDVGFIDALVAQVRARLPIDRKRIHLAGFSNGARFAMRLAVERSRRYASASAMAGGIELVKDPPRHLPVLFGRGTDDLLFLAGYNAEEGTDLERIPLPFSEAMTVLGDQLTIQAVTLGLRPAVRTVAERAMFTRATWSTPEPGEDDGQVMRFLLMDGVAHEYARASNNPNGFVFADLSWRFFRQHPLP